MRPEIQCNVIRVKSTIFFSIFFKFLLVLYSLPVSLLKFEAVLTFASINIAIKNKHFMIYIPIDRNNFIEFSPNPSVLHIRKEFLSFTFAMKAFCWRPDCFVLGPLNWQVTRITGC